MESHQLADPHEYVLRVFAAAILRGARHFELKARADTLVCEWDGAAFCERELAELVPSLLSSDPERQALRELAVGLNAARKLYPEIELSSGGQRLRLARGELTLAPAEESGLTRLRLKRPTTLRSLLLRLLRRRTREQVLLWKRTRLAPLSGLPPLNAAPHLALQLGTPPAELRAPVFHLPEKPEGCGYVLYTPERRAELTVIHCGVTYRCRAPWKGPVQVLWWTTSLLLDLSRARVVQPEWFAWALDTLAEVTLPQLESGADMKRMAPLVGMLLDRRVAGLERLPLFRRPSLAAVTLAELRAQVAREGWLGRASHPFDDERAVLWDEAARLVLPRVFDNWVDVADRSPCPLPAGAYLVRMPLANCPGEVGLAAETPDGRLLVRHGEGVAVEHRVAPAGIVLQLAPDGPEDDWPIPMVPLYRALGPLDLPRELKAAHWLEFLTWARDRLVAPPTGQSALGQLLRPEAARELAPELPERWLRELISQVLLPTNRGTCLPLLELRKSSRALFYCPPEELAGDDHLVLSLGDRAAERLDGLLRPRRSLRRALPWTPGLHAVAQQARRGGPISSLDLLWAMREVPTSGAAEVLLPLLGDGELPPAERRAGPPRYTAGARRVFRRARQEASARQRLSSEIVLQAMLEVDCRAGAVLRELGVDRTALKSDSLPVERELRVVAPRARAALEQGELDQAEVQLRRTAELGPQDAMARGQAALDLFLAGQTELALEMYARALSLRPDPASEAWLRSHQAEALLALGHLRAARSACQEALGLEALQPHANALQARLLRDARAAVRQCRKAREIPGCPASAWETEGLLLLRLGQLEEGRRCLEEFVRRAEREPPPELDVAGRLARARALLRGDA